MTVAARYRLINGTRVRIKDTCAWPERRGLEASVVSPPADGTYPQPAKWEVLLKVDNDPLSTIGEGPCAWSNESNWWSCVMPAKDLEVIE